MEVDDYDLRPAPDTEARGGGAIAGGDDDRAVTGGMAAVVVAEEEWLEDLHWEDLPGVGVSREGKVYPADLRLSLPVLTRSVL